MVNVRFKRTILVIVMLLSVVFASVSLNGFTIAKAITPEEDVSIFYSGNRNVVKNTIDDVKDSEPVYFKQLKDDATLDATQKLAIMQRMVDVAKAYESLTKAQANVEKNSQKAFETDQMLQVNYEEICKQAQDNLTSNYHLSKHVENLANYDSDGAYVQQINGFKKELSVLNEKVLLANELSNLLEITNKNPNAKANQVFGVYDKTAKPSSKYGYDYLQEVYGNSKRAIDEAQDPVEARKEGVKALNEVPRNGLEKAYDDYLAVTAYERGETTKEDADIDNNELYKDYTVVFNRVKDFYDNAAESVKKAYNTDYKTLQNYFETHQEFDGAKPNNNNSTLSYKVNGKVIMTIDAYIKQGFTPNARANVAAKVFAPNATIRLYPATLSGEERSVASLLAEKNNKLSVGYLVRFNVYGGHAQSQVFDTERADKETEGGVVYVISFNLKNYYEQIVQPDKGMLGGLLQNISLSGLWGTKDKTAGINEAYNITQEAKISLCYMYQNGALTEFENHTYDSNGGILMLTTSSFGNFAIAAAATGGEIFANPLFWILLAVLIVVVIVLIHIIRKMWKYKVKFESNGGTPVETAKARLGEYFKMPENPTREGYVFRGWFEDPELTKRFLSVRILKRKALYAYAKWSLELSPDRVDRYYQTLRNELASHKALPISLDLAEGEEKTYAVIEKLEKQINLYFVGEVTAYADAGYQVKTAGARYENTPVMFEITAREDFLVAQKLVAQFIKDNTLLASDCEEMADGETTYALTFTYVAPIEEEVVAPAQEEVEVEVVEEEPAEEVVEETTEEVVEEEPDEVIVEIVDEEPAEEVVEEEVVEEEVVEEPEEVTDEQLINYFTTIRNAVTGYALYELNDKAENGKMLVKLYKKDEAVYCYLALDAEAYNLEQVGLGFSDTPALIKVASDEDLEKALSLVEVVMTEHGFEPSGEEVPEKPYEGKGFGYRIHFVEEE